jgi:hypothetical protein
LQITPAQIRAAHEALGLDPDLTLHVSISPGYVHVTTAELDEGGHPIVTGGVLQRVETSVETTTEGSAS